MKFYQPNVNDTLRSIPSVSGRLFTGLCILTAAIWPTPSVAAETCPRWQVGMEEVEGGNAMIARICNAAGGSLSVECGAPSQLVLAYSPTSGDFLPNGNPDFKGNFTISAGDMVVQREMTYQAMDGLMVLDMKFDDPLAKALGAGDQISLTSATPGIPPASFTLSGSAAAIAGVMNTCRRGG
jgi:hypothetical protein